MGLFERMLDREVREGFLRYKQGGVFFPADELERMQSYILSQRCEDDILRLMAGEYFFQPPRQFVIRRSRSGKKRLVHDMDGDDKTLLRLMAFVLQRDCDYLFAKGLYSFRSGRSVPDLILLLKNTRDLEKKYILKADVTGYGDNVDGDILLEDLERVFGGDPAAMGFFRWMLRWRTCRLPDGTVRRCAPAVMTGLPLTSFFENLYLSEVDWHFKGLGIPYGRYADDIVLYADDRERALEYEQYLEQVMARRKLTLHQDKSMILPPGTPVEVLGMKLTGRQVDIADASIAKLRWKMYRFGSRMLEKKRRFGISDDEAMRRMIFYADRKFFGVSGERHELSWSRWAFPLLDTTEGLKRLDRIVQDAVRYVGTGKQGPARYRVQYEKLRQLGYRSLVNEYYHRYERSPWEPEDPQRLTRELLGQR